MPRLARLALLTLCVGTVLVLFVAPLYVAYDRKTLTPGEAVEWPHGSVGTVERVEGGQVTIRKHDGSTTVVPRDQVWER